MVSRLDSVCKYICEKSNWTISNLQLQKILYMAQMYYMAENEAQKLVEARFEAWEYGPVEPSLHRKVRMFGAGPIEDVFYEARPFKADDRRRAALDEVCASLLPLRAGVLVSITHWEKGAWAKIYVPGVKGIPIPDDAILQEYRDRAPTSGSKELSGDKPNPTADTAAIFEHQIQAQLRNIYQERYMWIFIVIALLNILIAVLTPWGVEAIFLLFSMVLLLGSAHRLEVPWIVTHLDRWSKRANINQAKDDAE
jgi:uncharacterized phage-associated protein